MTDRNFLIQSIFIFCFTFFICSIFRHFDPDLWGHLKFGEYIIATKSLPIKDIYSFVLTKSLWVNHEWLSEVVFQLLMSLNYSGMFLLLFKALAFTTAILLPWFFTGKDSKHTIFNLLLYVVIILSFSYGTAIRPQIFSYLFFSLTILILESYKLKGFKTYIYLFIIFITWVNMHGGVIAGLCLVYYYSLYNIFSSFYTLKTTKEKISSIKFILLPVLLTFTLLLTPYTYHYLTYIADAILLKRSFVEEWQPMFSSFGNFFYTQILMLLSIALFLLNIKNPDKEKLFHIVILVLLAVLCIKHTRHIPFFAIACAYYLPGFLEYAIDNFFKNRKFADNKIAKYTLSIILVVMSCVFMLLTFINSYKLNVNLVTTPYYTGYPVETAKFIKQKGLKGRMITNFNWGEFIIYNLSPDIKVSFDGRYETVYPDEIVKDNLTFINGKKGWEKVLNKFNPEFILVSRYDPITEKLILNNNWPIIFKDYEAILFINPDRFKISKPHK